MALLRGTILFQDMIPVVDGLLPEPYNAQLLTLLYRMAEWHALAKLRMHTDYTLQGLDKATTVIGCELRSFREWSRASFTVKELPSETRARTRRTQRAKVSRRGAAAQPGAATNASISVTNIAVAGSAPTAAGASTAEMNASTPSARVRILNLFTYKLHALGDYVRTIRLFGTTDSYSTQIVCFCWHDLSWTVLMRCTGRTCPSACEAFLSQNKQD